MDMLGERMDSEAWAPNSSTANGSTAVIYGPLVFPSLSPARSYVSPGVTKRNQKGFLFSSQPGYLWARLGLTGGRLLTYGDVTVDQKGCFLFLKPLLVVK